MQGRLRKLFTNAQILAAVDEAEGYAAAARKLSASSVAEVSPELLRYWYRGLTEVTRKDGEPYIGTTVLDRKIRNNEVKIRGTRADLLIVDDVACDNSRILHFCDTHAPYQHKDAISFLAEVQSIFKPTRVVHGGDEVDNHALSFHDSDPNLDAAGAELYKAREVMAALHDLFPNLEVLHSNHGSLVYRRALKAGIPVEYLKTYREILFPHGAGQGWNWHESLRLELPNGEDILFLHQCPGDVTSAAAHERCNLVLAHEHSKFEVTYRASKAALYFGMYGGSLIDFNALAFAYGKTLPKRPIIGCSLIIDSQPVQIPMLLDRHGRWTGRVGGLK